MSTLKTKSVFLLWLFGGFAASLASFASRHLVDSLRMSSVPGLINLFIYSLLSFWLFRALLDWSKPAAYTFLLAALVSIPISFRWFGSFSPFGVLLWEIRKLFFI